MATSKPRITITLEPRAYEVVSRLAAANRKSMSAIVTDFLDLARPQMERMVVILERANQAPDQARAEIRQSLERAESVLLPTLLKVIDQQDLFLREEAGLDADEVEGWEYVPGAGGRQEAGGSASERPAPGGTGGRMYSALNPAGERVLLPVGKAFDRHGVVVDVAPPPVPVTRGVGSPKRASAKQAKGGRHG